MEKFKILKNFKYLIKILLFSKFCVWIKKIKIMRMKKMNEKQREDVVCVLVIRVSLCSHPIDILGAQTMFFE